MLYLIQAVYNYRLQELCPSLYCGRSEGHSKLLSSSFPVSTTFVFVFLQRTIPRNSGVVILHKHKCSQCHRSYVSLSGLRAREATHSGRYLYWCKVCGKGFPAISNLRGHMAHHTGVAEFKCDICGRQFRYPQDYKRHLKQHSQESSRDRQLI